MSNLRNAPLAALVERLENDVPGLMEAWTVPGLSVTVIHSGAIAWNGAFGVRHRDTREPVTPDTLFEAQSLSKPLFALATLKLCASGALDLDTPLVEYVPDGRIVATFFRAGSGPVPLELAVPGVERITARHALSHTTGFPNWPPDDEPLQLHFAPGERFSYSGMAYSALQIAVESITGRAAEEYVRTEVLEPLGMVNSRLVWTGEEDLPVAAGHDASGEPAEKRVWPVILPGASLHSTPADFATLVLAVMRPSPDRFDLPLDWIEEMLTPQVSVAGQVSYGLGWGIQHTAAGAAFWHWGAGAFYHNFVVGFRQDGAGIVIMTNGEHGNEVYSRIMRESVGGEYPSLDWLSE